MLGLVGINMSMLYGEGGRAFHRLQLEFIQQPNEHTIFAWQSTLAQWRGQGLEIKNLPASI
jgi:hypothetical protein